MFTQKQRKVWLKCSLKNREHFGLNVHSKTEKSLVKMFTQKQRTFWLKCRLKNREKFGLNVHSKTEKSLV